MKIVYSFPKMGAYVSMLMAKWKIRKVDVCAGEHVGADSYTQIKKGRI